MCKQHFFHWLQSEFYIYLAGSVYCDNEIRNSGSIGEHVQSGSVLVVKTHRDSLRFSNYTVSKNVTI